MLWASDAACADATPHEIAVWRSGRVLVADAGTKTVRFVPEAEASTGPRVPMGSLLKPVFSKGDIFSLMSGLSDRAGDDAAGWIFDEVPERIRSARTVNTVLQAATLDEARKAFLAVCCAWQPMSEEDFDAAVSWKPSGPAP